METSASVTLAGLAVIPPLPILVIILVNFVHVKGNQDTEREHQLISSFHLRRYVAWSWLTPSFFYGPVSKANQAPNTKDPPFSCYYSRRPWFLTSEQLLLKLLSSSCISS